MAWPGPQAFTSRKVRDLDRPASVFYGGHYYPKELVATVAPGGRGKSLLSHAELLAMISGKPLLGEFPSRQLKSS